MKHLNSYYASLPVLVTGGCGFIGSHLAQALTTLGARVTIIDDCSSGTLTNIASFRQSIRFVRRTITDPLACLEATQGKKIIFHCAAFTCVPRSFENPSACHHANVDGTFNLLEAARLQGVERLIFSSSAAVYGNHNGLCSEELPCYPASPYGYSKLMGELYCKQYAQQFGLLTASLRYFNVYGERQDHLSGSVRATFKHRMAHNLPITIFGSGKQTRDFVPVEQVVHANLLVGMQAPEILQGGVYNVASGKSINLLELVQELRNEFPAYSGNIEFEGWREGDLLQSQADCSKYNSLISL